MYHVLFLNANLESLDEGCYFDTLSEANTYADPHRDTSIVMITGDDYQYVTPGYEHLLDTSDDTVESSVIEPVAYP